MEKLIEEWRDVWVDRHTSGMNIYSQVRYIDKTS